MEDRMRILLCEDDENLGMLLREYLQAKGYNADLFVDGESGYKAFLKGKYDICVLDVMMPKKDGFALAQEIRMVNSEVPIIFLTAKSLKEDILEGFKIGADDYITKPFSMEELVFRIEAILRRVKGKIASGYVTTVNLFAWRILSDVNVCCAVGNRLGFGFESSKKIQILIYADMAE